MTPLYSKKLTTLKDLRLKKREWIASTFSIQDLKKKGGITQEEIDNMDGKILYGKKRYDKEYVKSYLMEKQHNIFN